MGNIYDCAKMNQFRIWIKINEFIQLTEMENAILIEYNRIMNNFELNEIQIVSM